MFTTGLILVLICVVTVQTSNNHVRVSNIDQSVPENKYLKKGELSSQYQVGKTCLNYLIDS